MSKSFDELTIADDFMFCTVMNHQNCTSLYNFDGRVF
ncbi:hypothetical protein J2Z29_000398 [Treponema pedis]